MAGLINETNAQYYAGQQPAGFLVAPTQGDNVYIEGGVWSFDTKAKSAYSLPLIPQLVPSGTANNFTQTDSVSNFELYYQQGGVGNYLLYPEELIRVTNEFTNEIEIMPKDSTVVLEGNFYIQLKSFAISNNYGGYSYITIKDIVNNFLVGYVGEGKLISKVKKQDVVFHAKRGLQEFSYDTLKSINQQELTVPPSLSLPIPQDYVNYVKCSWVDDVGAKHIIYPTAITSNPTDLPLQDSDGIPVQDVFSNNQQSPNSITEDRWASINSTNNLSSSDFRQTRGGQLFGRKYGLEPSEAQINGWWTINERLGKFSFSSDLVGKLIIIEYISDGLAYGEDMKIPKMAEQAMYMHIAHAILSTRANVPEYLVSRYKKERSVALRNTKIRLSNIKIEEISQVFRNKGKWIKH